MKHLTLQGTIVFEVFEKKEGKEVTQWCKRVDKNKIIMSTKLENDIQPILTEVDSKRLFCDYIYYYGKDKAFDKLKEINFKFE